MGLATVINIGFVAWATYRRYQVRWKKDISPSPRPSGKLSIRRLPHAILSAARIWGFRLRIPYVEMTLVEFFLGIMYMAGCLAFVYSPLDTIKPMVNLVPKYWGAKAGLLGAAQLPLAVFLALKNNPVTWLTGLGHEKLILMHRIVSRCIFVLTWIHFVGEYYRAPRKLLSAGWKVAGLIGGVAQTITTIFGIKQIRHAYYELFYSSHVVLILTLIITIHVHCIPMESEQYVWPCYIIWGADRLLRGSRYVLFNLILRPKNRKALIEDIGSDGLRVTLKRRIPGGWKAGQHVFLAFPGLDIQSHPFTIGKVYEKEEGGDEAEMQFIIRAQGGQTRMLMERAMPTGRCELNALFDGPYGHPEDIRAFTTCIFIAGGTGVTYTVARMHQLFKDIHASDARATRVVFVWAIRTETEYSWVASDIAKIVALAPSLVSLLVDIYITGGARTDKALPELEKDFDIEKDTVVTSTSTPTRTQSLSSSERCDNEKMESGATTPTTAVNGVFAFHRPGVTRKDGRPDMRRILEEEITVSEGAVAVDVSGPDGLISAVRSALSQPFTGPLATMRGTPTVLLSVEQFRM
ncbi:Ferric reductase transmembrane component 4 [Trametes pubescens]|uniref:ferric-chelate reductase (NADPH) n=1 Tax=Trametes pubescens TaxID=154538 RepID=A0A1M2VK69_TRAPU|nr:Ferric reductase transmembrane component 4 [Trametes pubescens]